MQGPSDGSDPRAEAAALCDEAERLLAEAEPRPVAVAALLERAEACVGHSDEAELIGRIGDLRDRLSGQSSVVSSPWRDWLIPGLFAATAAVAVWSAFVQGSENLALGAKISASSTAGPSNPSALIDGNSDGEEFRTEQEDHPYVVFDLGRPRAFDTVEVFRSQDRGPLQVEISIDGEVYGEYGSRKGSFRKWTIDKSARARFVRIRRMNAGKLNATEVRIVAS